MNSIKEEKELTEKYIERYKKYHKKTYPNRDKNDMEHSVSYFTTILPIFVGSEKEIKKKILAYSSIFPELKLFGIRKERKKENKIYNLQDDKCLIFYSVKIMSTLLNCIDITSQKFYIPHAFFTSNPDLYQLSVRKKIVHIFSSFCTLLKSKFSPSHLDTLKLIGELPHERKDYEKWKGKYTKEIEKLNENDTLFQVITIKEPTNHTNFFVFRKKNSILESILYDPKGTNREDRLSKESKEILDDYLKENLTERKQRETKLFLQKKIQDRLGFCTHISLYIMFILITYLSMKEEEDIFSLLVKIDDFVYDTVIKKMKFIYTTDKQVISDFFTRVFMDFIKKLHEVTI